MKRVVLITGHYYQSKRRAGFHWLAEAYARAGWEVIFVTAALSWLSWIRRDYRLAYPLRQEANRLRWVEDRLGSFVWLTPWHPANLRSRWLNRLAKGLFARYGEFSLGEATEKIETADLIIFESTPALVAFDRFKRLNPNARYIYRVSDYLPLLNNHPIVLEAEKNSAPQFDMISVPSQFICSHFESYPTTRLHYHGIRKDLFDQDCPSPYPKGSSPNVVFVGNNRCDTDFLDRACRMFPTWMFHVIGPIPNLPQHRNLVVYGERPFLDTIPYIKHADIGLQARTYSPGAESLTDSLKVIQYTYCGLPVVAPEFLRTERTHSFYYAPGDNHSIRTSLEEAQTFDRSQICRAGISSWDELAQTLAESNGTGD